MLDPDRRTLYTDALRPPPGFRFKEALATTYSLDLETLLTVPLHLALFSAEGDTDELLQDSVALLEALRRTTDHVTVYAQGSRLMAPSQPNVLFGLLESCVVEVDPPSKSGVFHPKLWLIRFEQPTTGSQRLRLLVLSRNITNDRSWDLALTLEGVPGDVSSDDNRALERLIERLPGLALRSMPGPRGDQATRLAELAGSAEWELPGDFERLRFHALGLEPGEGWLPERSRRLAVISPFVSDRSLRELADTTQESVVLVARPEELQEVSAESVARFEHVRVLAEEAEREDGEDSLSRLDPLHPSHGLHAKAYLAERGWWTHLYLGSANATNAALVHGANVEILAELVGRRSRVGEIESLLSPEGFGALLVDFQRDDDALEQDEESRDAEARVEEARRSLASSGLRLRFEPAPDGEWAVTMTPERPPLLQGLDALRAWLITRRSTLASDALSLGEGLAVQLPPATPAHLTTFVAFELEARGLEEPVRFVLGLSADGLPRAERDAAVVRDVVRDRDGFLRYVALLLAEAGQDGVAFGSGGSFWRRSRALRGDAAAVPVFEQMTKAFCDQPDRLESVQRLLTEMGVDRIDEDGVVPGEFLELWAVFQEALAQEGGSAR